LLTMVAGVGVCSQVQTCADPAPVLLTVAKSALDERLTNSLRCLLNR
jgi:hypothetical protein